MKVKDFARWHNTGLCVVVRGLDGSTAYSGHGFPPELVHGPLGGREVRGFGQGLDGIRLRLWG